MAGDVRVRAHGRAGPLREGRLEVGDERERVDLHADRAGRPSGRLPARRGDGGHGLTRILDRIPGEGGPVGVSGPRPRQARHVVRADRDHTGDRPGRREVDRTDLAVRNGGEDERTPEHAFDVEVRPEDHVTADLRLCVGPDRPHSCVLRWTVSTARTIAA